MGLVMTQETAQKESEPSIVGTDAFSLAKRIFSVIHILRFSLWWGIALWAITGIAAILYTTGFFDNESYLAGVFWLAVFVIWIVGPFMMIQMRYASKVLKDWEGNYLAYSHIMSFELSPKEDQDLTRDIVRNLTEMRAIKPGPPERFGRTPTYDVEYSSKIEGKKGLYEFDALILSDEMGFVRVFKDQDRKTGIEDIKTLAEQVNDVVKEQNADILEVVAVSKAGFTEEAVKYASSKENWIGPNRDAVNLIHATPEGYAITWMQYPRVSVDVEDD
jgi:fibronectin type 3 domain-containing protein